MVAVLFSKVLEDAQKRSNPKYGSVELRDFLRDKALKATSRNVNPVRLMNTKKAQGTSYEMPMPGRMTCFFYDAKYKDTLPYWDKFPVTIPIEITGTHMLALNMHYLPPIFRARLMDALYTVLNNKKYDETTKFKLSYDILKAAAKFKYFKPCIKKYILSRVQSKFVTIDIRDADYVVMLPLARFQKANQRKVWDDSLNKIMKS